MKIAITDTEKIARFNSEIDRRWSAAASVLDRINRLDNPHPKVIAAIEKRYTRMVERINGIKAEIFYLENGYEEE